MRSGADPRRAPPSGGPLAVVLDMGGNWTRAALATPSGEILWKERTPTEAKDGTEAIIARVLALVDRAIYQARDGRVAGIGMGLAGPIDPETGVMYDPPNLPALDGVSLKSVLEKRMEYPVAVGNDATLAALGEYSYGDGAGARTLVYMTVSTGIGGGVVIEGRPLMGANGMAGELGHMTVDTNGPRCKCGHVGCLETLASGTAIAERGKRLVEGQGSNALSSLVDGHADRVSAETVFQAAAQGDAPARGVLDDVSRALGAGLVNLLHIFNPDVIVMGGGVSNEWESLRPGVELYIETHAMAHVRKLGFKLLVSSLGDDIGLLGAAALVWQGQAPQPSH